MACECLNICSIENMRLYTCVFEINPVAWSFNWLISGKLYLTYSDCRTVGHVMVKGAAGVRVVNVFRNGREGSAKSM